MNDSRLIVANAPRCGACCTATPALTDHGPASVLAAFLLRALTAPWRLHGYRNLNTRLVRDAFCNRDCGTGADD